MHPNEILNKIKNINEKDRKVIHHYSNSLKVNSNLEKLEEKVNNDEENINIEQFGEIKKMIQGNNCSIFQRLIMKFIHHFVKMDIPSFQQFFLNNLVAV